MSEYVVTGIYLFIWGKPLIENTQHNKPSNRKVRGRIIQVGMKRTSCLFPRGKRFLETEGENNWAQNGSKARHQTQTEEKAPSVLKKARKKTGVGHIDVLNLRDTVCSRLGRRRKRKKRALHDTHNWEKIKTRKCHINRVWVPRPITNKDSFLLQLQNAFFYLVLI